MEGIDVAIADTNAETVNSEPIRGSVREGKSHENAQTQNYLRDD